MAENEEKSASIPWLPLITFIAVGSGLVLFFPQLTSSRPGGGDNRLGVDTFDSQTVDARLWQDPLGVAVADREKKQKDSDAHSITRFQNLLINKCFAELPIYPLEQKLRFAEQEKRLQLCARQLQILAVMIPGGPYVEDIERRLRNRRAVIEGLETVGYDPEKDHQIAYFSIPWQPLDPNIAACVSTVEKNRDKDERGTSPAVPGIQPTRSNWTVSDQQDLIVPYEWYEPTDFGPEREPRHVLVLWLVDDAFRDAPLARLADLVSWFRLKFLSASMDVHFFSPPVFKVLGPENSGTLHKMVIEASDAPWNDDTRQCLAATHIYSSQAAVAESLLLSGIPEAGELRTSKNLIEKKVRGLASGSGFIFERINLLDDKIVDTLWEELALRHVKTIDDVAIISEEDTYYARALCESFGASKVNVHSYTYLRGIDGKLPSDEKDTKDTKDAAESGAKSSQSNLRPTEPTEGTGQVDDIRRLAEDLRKLDTDLRHSNKALKAVGLLGSDVYDKLELLKALRPVLPEAVFFTNNLDARFAHPDELNETHNLLVVSAFDLLVNPEQGVPRFRDSYQTALFAATREAMGQTRDVIPKSPLIFEIGRNEPKNLNVVDKSVTMRRMDQVVWGVIGFSGFILCGISLLAWTYFVSRVPK